MPLDFRAARSSPPPSPQRTDIACFVGYVARRRTPLPPAVVSGLRIAGWIDGIQPVSEARIDALEQLPVTVESWDDFVALFAWRTRPIAANGTAGCASYLGAAVRRFFADGGQRAVIVRTGDPWSYLEPAGARQANRAGRLDAIVGTTDRLAFDATNPASWRGLQHLYGLPEVSLLCLPDLADVCADDAVASPAVLTPPVPDDPNDDGDASASREPFVECSATEITAGDDRSLRRIQAPRCDDAGLASWQSAIARARRFLADHRRDVVILAALPLLRNPAASRDPLAYTLDRGLFQPTGAEASGSSTAYLQLAYPWIATRSSDDLPEHLEPPDGVLAGAVAAGAIARGTFRSVAGRRLPAVLDSEPLASWRLGLDGPWNALAERVCLIAREPDGWALQSDVTTSPSPSWRNGGTTRLIASLLRAARAVGEIETFAANGPELWARVQRHLETLLTDYWLEGGLAGASPDEAFEVRCDRRTMTQNDLDAGRVIVTVSVRPVTSITHITVVLSLSAAGQLVGAIREVA